MGKPNRKICGNCGRVGRRDLGRKYCPVTASGIYANKPADNCLFYSDKDKTSVRKDEEFWEECYVC